MAYNPSKIGRLYARMQTDYETPHASSDVISASYAMEAEMVVPPTTREIFERAAVRGGFYEIAPVSGSQHGATFTVSKPLHGISSSALTDNPTVNIADAALLYSILGAWSQGNYQASGVASSGSTVSSVALNEGEESYVDGLAFLADGKGGFVNGLDYTANTLTPFLNLSAAPSGGSTIFGSNTVYLSSDAAQSFTMVWRGKENATQLVLQSCVATQATITIGPKDSYPRLEVSFVCNAIASETASESITDYDYSVPVLPVPTSESSARMVFASTSGGQTASELDIEALTITIAQELAPQLSHNATSGVADMQVTNRTVEVAFKGVLGSANPFDTTGKVLTDIENSAPKALQLQLGSSSGQSFMMLLPSPVQSEVPVVEDLGGVWALSFKLMPGNYGGSGTTVADSNFRVAWL